MNRITERLWRQKAKTKAKKTIFGKSDNVHKNPVLIAQIHLTPRKKQPCTDW
jgi:hypothetical protein